MRGRWMFGLIIAIAVAIAAPASAGAKGQKKAKAGGTHSMTGCLQKGTEANTYTLTSVEGTGPKTVELVEMASGVNLAPHVGHKGRTLGPREKEKAGGRAEGTQRKKKKKRGKPPKKGRSRKVGATPLPVPWAGGGRGAFRPPFFGGGSKTPAGAFRLFPPRPP